VAEDERELWLGELLDTAADRYEPDTERLKAMVTARIAQQSDEASASRDMPSGRRASSRNAAPRRAARGRGLGLIGRLGLAGIPAGVAVATIGAAAALAVGATATIAVTSSHGHGSVTVSAPSSTPGHGGSSSQAPVTSAGPSSAGTATRPTTSGTSGSTSTSSSTSGDTTSSTLVAATPSINRSSIADWSELDLTVDVKQPLTALDVTVKVSKCDGLASTGSWNSGATGQFTETTTTDSDGSITYQFELTKDDEVSAGVVTFAAQFDHAATGWNVADDTYYVAARTATSTTASSVHGAYQ